jgi:DNA gyrase subunit B
MELNTNGSDLIRVLDYPECVRMKHGMYLSSPTDMLRECIDNSTDEVLACKTCNLIIVDTNFDGYNLVCDQGRGIPIFLSPDRPGQTQADVAVSTLHAGSKFVNQDSKIGTYGIGVSATNALSTHFWVLSKITQENYDKSLPVVKNFYESLGPRSKKEVFYYAYYEKGIKISEGAAKKSELEKMMGVSKALPEGMSTMTLFVVDPEIFPSQRVEIPVENLENFLFIQEKFYRRKIQVIANGQVLTSASIKPYQFEILRTITPADISKNPYIGVYVTFEVDATLSPKKSAGSVNGLVVNNGVHIQYLEGCFEAALREEYKIKHKTIFPGLKMWVIILAEDLVYDSQIKSRLRSISKVKASDFQEITKDFIKIFRKNEDYWLAHVNKLNALAESYRSIGAIEKAQKMIDSATGNNAFRSKQEYVEGFADATSHDRWGCELFVCFTGDTEVTTFDDERISMVDLEKKINAGEEIYTFSCKSDSTLVPSRIKAAKKIKEVTELCKVSLDNGESFVCTPDHKHMLRNGEYKEAKDLQMGDLMMSLDIEEEIRVKSIEIYNTVKTPVYCIEVTSKEHNFPLAAGIFTKNCEGLSAASGLKAGRKSSEYHAVLPLRGKVLNVKDASVDEALANKEIFTLLKVIGLGIDANNVTSDCKTREEAYEKIKKYSRYGKICIATDEDPDGDHIRILLLYLISKYARFLVDFGLVYIAQSPLYAQDGKYFYSNDPLQPGTSFPVGLVTTKSFHRWKGLGSIPKDEVYNAFYNPATRRLIQVTPDGIDYFMSLVEDIDKRKELLYNNGILGNPFNLID